MTTGRVTVLGLVRKSAMRNSLNEITNANSAPTAMPGRIAGTVMRKNARTGPAPSTRAASSAE